MLEWAGVIAQLAAGPLPLEESKDLDNEKRCDNDYEKDESAQSASLHLLHAFRGWLANRTTRTEENDEQLRLKRKQKKKRINLDTFF